MSDEIGIGRRLSRAFNRLFDWTVDRMPDVYQPSVWKEPALAYNDTPTDALMGELDRDKVLHLHEYYKIADALSWEIGKYFISKKDTATFLMPFSSDLAQKANQGAIESWVARDFVNNRRDVYAIRAGDLLDHIAENPLPGDDWHVKTLERKGMFAGELRNRPLQIRKLMVLSAVLATDLRDEINARPQDYWHRVQGGAAPSLAAPAP